MAAAPNIQKGQQQDDQSRRSAREFRGLTEAEIDKAIEGLKPEEEEIIELSDEDLVAVPPPLPERAKRSASTRVKVKEVFQEAPLLIEEATVDSGGKAETLRDALTVCELPGGIKCAAATSFAGYKYAKDRHTGQPKNRNEDRWCINPKTGFVAAIDGMGGGDKGEYTAQKLGESFLKNETDIQRAVREVQEDLAQQNAGSNDGACFISAKVSLGPSVKLGQSGDSGLIHYSATGTRKYSPGDQLELGHEPQSFLEKLEEMRMQQLAMDEVEAALGMASGTYETGPFGQIVARIVNNQTPVVTRDNPYYDKLRSMVTKAVTKKPRPALDFDTGQAFEPGDVLLLMSDGISDNFTDEELDGYVQEAIRLKWSPEDLVRKISDELDRRTKLAAADDPEAIQNHYKLDNATIIVLMAPAKVAKAA